MSRPNNTAVSMARYGPRPSYATSILTHALATNTLTPATMDNFIASLNNIDLSHPVPPAPRPLAPIQLPRRPLPDHPRPLTFHEQNHAAAVAEAAHSTLREKQAAPWRVEAQPIRIRPANDPKRPTLWLNPQLGRPPPRQPRFLTPQGARLPQAGTFNPPRGPWERPEVPLPVRPSQAAPPKTPPVTAKERRQEWEMFLSAEYERIHLGIQKACMWGDQLAVAQGADLPNGEDADPAHANGGHENPGSINGEHYNADTVHEANDSGTLDNVTHQYANGASSTHVEYADSADSTHMEHATAADQDLFTYEYDNDATSMHVEYADGHDDGSETSEDASVQAEPVEDAPVRAAPNHAGNRGPTAYEYTTGPRYTGFTITEAHSSRAGTNHNHNNERRHTRVNRNSGNQYNGITITEGHSNRARTNHNHNHEHRHNRVNGNRGNQYNGFTITEAHSNRAAANRNNEHHHNGVNGNGGNRHNGGNGTNGANRHSHINGNNNNGGNRQTHGGQTHRTYDHHAGRRAGNWREANWRGRN
ncbi:hypothetical protein EDC01DRAFT_628966 [Geopyxis carbonaria]|nr:hypothetical protein EDC01DRAFT_628966 [Geopyxis carbonaria]